MRAFLVVAFLGLASSSVLGQMLPPNPIDPAAYFSPSRHFELYVDPTTPQGNKPCNLTLSHDGVPVWKKTLPYVILEATVDDAGRVGGYGYEGSRFYNQTGTSFLHVMCLDQKGKALKDDAFPLHMYALDAPDAPYL